jgi:hypothetical protein
MVIGKLMVIRKLMNRAMHQQHAAAIRTVRKVGSQRVINTNFDADLGFIVFLSGVR